MSCQAVTYVGPIARGSEGLGDPIVNAQHRLELSRLGRNVSIDNDSYIETHLELT